MSKIAVLLVQKESGEFWVDSEPVDDPDSFAPESLWESYYQNDESGRNTVIELFPDDIYYKAVIGMLHQKYNEKLEKLIVPPSVAQDAEKLRNTEIDVLQAFADGLRLDIPS